MRILQRPAAGLAACALWLSVSCSEGGSPPSGADAGADDTRPVEGSSAAVTEPQKRLTAVWGAAANDVWAVGPAGLVLHFDGRRWQQRPRVTDADLLGVHGHGARDVWAVGENVALHWNGDIWEVPLSNVSETLMGVWQHAPDDVWMVGLAWDSDRGLLRHWDGSEWQWTDIGSASTLWEVWGDGTNIWLAGTSVSGSGFLARGERMAFERASYPGSSLRGIWGSASEDLWVAPYSGPVQHWDGSEWREHIVGDADTHLLCVSGTGPRDAWAVGLHGTIVHWDGQAWSPVASHTERNLWSVWAAAPDDAWAVGGTIVHWDGKAWREVPMP